MKLERPRSTKGRGIYRLMRAFEALGPPVADRAEAASFRRGTLTIVVEDPTWLTELGFLKDEIRARLARIAGPDAPEVREIRLRLGKLERKQLRAVSTAEPVLDVEHEERVKSWGSAIRDEELRRVFERAARRGLAQPR